MIPDFVDGINLPPVRCDCTWDELVSRFARSSRRKKLCEELFVLAKTARRCGLLGVIIGGSFPTSKEEPGDLDLTWIAPAGVTKDDVSPECAELMNGTATKEKTGHDMGYCPVGSPLLECVVWAYGFDRRTGIERGVLVMDISCF